MSAQQLATSRERDFFRWLKLPMPIYRANVPIMTNASSSSAVDGRGIAELSVVLPSDHLRALHDEGPKENMFLGLFFSMWSTTWDWFRPRMLRYSVSAWGHGLTLETCGAPLDVMSVMSLRKVISRLSYMKTQCHIFQAPGESVNIFLKILFLSSGGRKRNFSQATAEEFVFSKLQPRQHSNCLELEHWVRSG